MTEHSRFWDGTATGDASEAPYDFGTELSEVLQAVIGAEYSPNKGGILRGISSFRGSATGMLTASGSATPVTVSTGLAFCYGSWYWNDSNKQFVVTTPGSTRFDRIVLRKDWSAQTVRLVYIVGTPGAGVPPPIGSGTPNYTQTYGTTWDIPLWTVQVTSGGAISYTDARDFLPYHGDQSGESGTKHAYTNLSGAPAISGSVTSVVPGAAGTAGAAGTISDGAHQHPLGFEPFAVSNVTRNFGTTTLADHIDLQLALDVGTYEINAVIIYSTSGVGDGIKADITFTGTASLFASGVGHDVSGILAFATATLPANFGGDGSYRILTLHAIAQVTVAGTLKARFAGYTTVAATQAGSSLSARKVA